MSACKTKVILSCLFLLVMMFVSGASFGQSLAEQGQPAQLDGAQPSPAASELEPVAVKEPSALALQFYRSGNWLWVLNVAWAVLLPGLLAFSGFAARVRNLAAKLAGGNWFFTIGLYVVMYLALVFVIELPLAFY